MLSTIIILVYLALIAGVGAIAYSRSAEEADHAWSLLRGAGSVSLISARALASIVCGWPSTVMRSDGVTLSAGEEITAPLTATRPAARSGSSGWAAPRSCWPPRCC